MFQAPALHVPGAGWTGFDLPSTTERTQWRHHASVTLHRATPAKDKKAAVIRLTHARHELKTPGPGAYEIAQADRVVKPRVRTTGFRVSTETTAPVPRHEVSGDPPLDVARADKWLSRFPRPKGAVTYRPPISAFAAAATRAQREKLRRLGVEKTRHTRIGFYSVRFTLTERRTGAVDIVAMDKSATTCGSESVRHVQARTRRQLRAWRAVEATPLRRRQQDAATEVASKPKRIPTVTVQWQRARARALLRQRDNKMRVQQDDDGEKTSHKTTKTDVGLSTRSLHRELPAHAMAKHVGRDTVSCLRKNLRVTQRFTSPPPKEQAHRHASSVTPPIEAAPTIALRGGVAYSTMLGRDEVTVDANGVYLVGQERDRELATHVPRGGTASSNPSDHAVCTRVAVVVMRPPHSPGRFVTATTTTTEQLVLSPKFTLVEPRRTRGHAFLAFDNQLDRRERAKPKAFAVETEPQDTRNYTARETLVVRRGDRSSVDYRRMVGRFESDVAAG